LSKGENEKALEFLDKAAAESEKRRAVVGGGSQSADGIFDLQSLSTTFGKIKLSRARVFKALGNYVEAKKEIDLGLKILEGQGNVREKAQAYNDLGNILFDEGDYVQAEMMHKTSLELREKIADKKGTAEAYNNLGIIYIEHGDYEKAAEMMEMSIKLMSEIGFRVGIAGTYTNLGAIYQGQGRYQDAYETHQKSLSISKEMKNVPGEIFSYGNLGPVCVDLERYDEAITHLEKGIELMHSAKIRILEPQALAWLSKAFLQLGRRVESKEKALKALDLAVQLKQRASVGFAKRMLGVIEADELRNSGKLTDRAQSAVAENHLKESLQIFTALKMEHEGARARLELASFYKLIGNKAGMEEHLPRAKEILEKLGAQGDLKRIKDVEST
jgi:tetratricopeptide (TPR) repeat protein